MVEEGEDCPAYVPLSEEEEVERSDEDEFSDSGQKFEDEDDELAGATAAYSTDALKVIKAPRKTKGVGKAEAKQRRLRDLIRSSTKILTASTNNTLTHTTSSGLPTLIQPSRRPID